MRLRYSSRSARSASVMSSTDLSESVAGIWGGTVNDRAGEVVVEDVEAIAWLIFSPAEERRREEGGKEGKSE